MKEEMKRTLIIYNTKETTQEEAAHLLDILNCDDSTIWDNADRCGVEIIEVPTDKTKNEMKTIAQQLNIKEFPFEIKDKNGREIYWENSNGDWCRKEYDSNGNETRYENSNGFIEDRGPKDGVVEIDTPEEMEHKNPLTNPAEHTLQELFAELKFGRPSASQEYLDKCIAELNEQEA
jgi:hypothetical protein